jgi:hypothetical protein
MSAQARQRSASGCERSFGFAELGQRGVSIRSERQEPPVLDTSTGLVFLFVQQTRQLEDVVDSTRSSLSSRAFCDARRALAFLTFE